MKHIVLSNAFEYGVEPFPAFRANLIFGRNKRDREFLPVKDVIPTAEYSVTVDYGKTVLYVGKNKTEAEKAKVKYDKEQEEQKSWKRATFSQTAPTLPEGKFRVIKTKEKGTILIVPGDDKTNRCLLFVGCGGGFRGGVSVVKDGTTGNILKICSAGNNCESATEVIAILEKGQSVAFYTYGRRTSEVYVYTWDGGEIEKKHYSRAEWDSRNAVGSADDCDVL